MAQQMLNESLKPAVLPAGYVGDWDPRYVDYMRGKELYEAWVSDPEYYLDRLRELMEDGWTDFLEHPWIRHPSCSNIRDETMMTREFLIAEVPAQFTSAPIEFLEDPLSLYVSQRGFRYAVESELISFVLAHTWSLYNVDDLLALGVSRSKSEYRRYVARATLRTVQRPVCQGDDRRGVRPLITEKSFLSLGEHSVGGKLCENDRILLVRERPPEEI